LSLFVLVALVVALCSFGLQPERAFADDLTVYVGYPGGPYYEKARYTDAQMTAMGDGVLYEYSTFDDGAFLRKGFGKGPRLETVFTNAGVNPWAVWRFYFDTADNYIDDDGGYGEGAWYYSELAGPKYYFPAYPQWYDFRGGAISDEGVDALWASAREVPTIIATTSSFRRVDGPDDEDWNSQTLRSDQGNRLLFGQAGPLTADARFAAHSVRSVTCIMSGIPTITFDVPSIEGRVGQEFTVTPHISAGDPLVETLGIYDIHWESSDESVATVVKNANGTITVRIVGEGSVSIDARFGESPYAEFVARAGFGVAGTGSGSDPDPDDDPVPGGGGGGGGGGDTNGGGEQNGTNNGGDSDGNDDRDGDPGGTGDDGSNNGGDDDGSNPDGNKVDVNNSGATGNEPSRPSPDEGATLITLNELRENSDERPDEVAKDEKSDEEEAEDSTDENASSSVPVTSSLPPGARATKLRLLSASEALKSGDAGAAGGGGGGGSQGGIVAGLMVTATDDKNLPLYLLAAATCLAFGSVRRVGSYQLAKDHIQARVARLSGCQGDVRLDNPDIPSAQQDVSDCQGTRPSDNRVPLTAQQRKG
jgi:hypothetical protein